MLTKTIIGALAITGLAGLPVGQVIAGDLSSQPAIVQQTALPQPLNHNDFAVMIHQQRVMLMAPWDEQVSGRLGMVNSSNYAGQSPIDSGGYKFYRHQYDDFTLYTSNLDWDKQQQSVDSYRIAQITLFSPDLQTARGIHIGSPEQDLVTAYGAGVYENYQDVQRRCYNYHGMELVFTLQQNEVSGIALVWSGQH